MSENKEIKKAEEELEYLSGDEEIRRIEELREKKIRDDLTNLKGAREEGEKNKSMEIAKKMKEEKISIEQIERITGLTKKEIENL